MSRVNLLTRRTSQVRARLDAVIEKAHGDLVLEGQDFGRAVEEVWGGGEYEYWVTVGAEERGVLMVMLVVERFGDDAASAMAWLRRHGIRSSGSMSGTTDAVQVGRGHRVRITAAQGRVTVRGSEFDRMTLTLLQDLFRSGRFTHSSAFRSWLSDHDVPARFFSYT